MDARGVTPFLLDFVRPVTNRHESSYHDEPTLEDLHPRPATGIEPSGDGTLMTEVKTETTDDN